MKRESLAFALSGTFFGLLVGWIIGSQHGATPPAPSASVSAPAPTSDAAATPPGRTVDAAQVARLEQQASAEPGNAAVRVELANLYFDAARYEAAIPWYQAALKLDPKNVNVSTDLAVSYYSLNQSDADKALAQFETSLAIDPRHLKTLLNQGIVRAFGKRDMVGAAESWQKVVDIAPQSEEGLRAAQGLEGLRAAAGHPTPGARASDGAGASGTPSTSTAPR